MATGPKDRTDGANQYKAQRQQGDGVDCIARKTYRQTEGQYYTDLYIAGYVEYNLGRERQHNVMSFSGTHTCISRSTMNSIKRDKLLVQIKQLASRAELSQDRCAAWTISPRIVFNKMQTPSLLLRTVRQSDCNQFQHQLTMATPMQCSPLVQSIMNPSTSAR